MFDRSTKWLKTGKADTFPAGENCTDKTTVTISPLTTCAGLVVTYNEKGKTKIYAAHLSSGELDDTQLETLKAIKACADQDTSIHSLYWAGADELDSDYMSNVKKVDAALGIQTDSRAETSFLRIDLQRLIAFGSTGKVTLGQPPEATNKIKLKKRSS